MNIGTFAKRTNKYWLRLTLSLFLFAGIFLTNIPTSFASCGGNLDPCDPASSGVALALTDFQKSIITSVNNAGPDLITCLNNVRDKNQGTTKDCLLALESLAPTNASPAKYAIVDSKIPAFNPMCWTEDQCYAIRAQLLGKQTSQLTDLEKEGWVKDQQLCPGENYGKCLPVGVSKTQISFGGKNKFLNIGDFISQMYRLAIGVASVLAVVMIIIAGFQWITSGGNSEAIQSAKHRISGAIIGVVIAFLSYAILNTINPNLVNLRLPQIYMIRPLAIIPQFCSAAPGGSFFSFTGKDFNDQTSKISPPSTVNFNLTIDGKPLKPLASPQLNANWKPDTFSCGKRFFLRDGGTEACFGDVCGEGRVCTDMSYKGKPATSKYTCFPGMLLGRIYGNTITGAQLAKSGEDLELIALCDGGKSFTIKSKTSIPSDEGEVRYSFSQISESDLVAPCGGKANLLGFYLGVTVHETLGSDDWYAIGQSAPGSRLCDTNLSSKAFNVIYGNYPSCTHVECTCSFLSIPQVRATLADKLSSDGAAKTDFTGHLISFDELKNGYQCDVSLNRADFPAADNNQIKRIGYGIGAGAVGAAALGATAITGGLAIPAWMTGSVLVGGGSFLGAFAGVSLADPTSCDTAINWSSTNSFLGK